MSRSRTWTAIIIASQLALVAACQTTSMPGGDDNSDASTNNTNDDASSNSTGNVTLTIRFDVTPVDVPSVRVLVFVNKGLLERFEVGDGDPSTPVEDFRARFSQGGGGLTQTFPRGTQICLICDESEEISSPFNNGLPPVSKPAQFSDWQGDTQGASNGADVGVLFFTMNESRTITARFVPMHAVILRSVGGANGTGTNMDIDVLFREPLTVPPLPLFGVVRGGNVVGTGLTGQQGQIGKFHFARDGTVMKFSIPAPSPFTSWSGDGAIGGREVTFTFGNRTQTADLNWP